MYMKKIVTCYYKACIRVVMIIIMQTKKNYQPISIVTCGKKAKGRCNN